MSSLSRLCSTLSKSAILFPVHWWIMKVKVYMLAFCDGNDTIREVTIPDDEPASVDQVFYFGQNEFAFGPEKNTTPSVSMGDVIEWEDGLYMVATAGFSQISSEQFEEYKALPRRDRLFHELTQLAE